jgi:mannose-6-phosphate isomerase-like protein (cupin superfamily)
MMMPKVEITANKGFRVVASTARSQAATMVLEPGSSTGGPQNRHPESDQWLFVLSGSASATVAGEQTTLGPGELLLIEAGQTHEIRNGGDTPLETLNFYAPKAY